MRRYALETMTASALIFVAFGVGMYRFIDPWWIC